jgi:hypothetical protein
MWKSGVEDDFRPANWLPGAFCATQFFFFGSSGGLKQRGSLHQMRRTPNPSSNGSGLRTGISRASAWAAIMRSNGSL